MRKGLKLKKSHIYLLFPFFLLLLWLLLFFYPLSSDVKGMKLKLSDLKRENEKLEGQVLALLETQKRVKEIEERLKELKIISFEQTTNFLRDTIQTARKKGVEVQRISSQFSSLKDIQKDSFSYPTFEMALKAKFLEIGRFLEGLQEDRSVKGVLKANLALDENDYPYIRAKITVELRTSREKR